MIAEFNESLLLKLCRDVHIYDSVNSVDINKYKTDHILQEFLQSSTPSGLPLSKLNLKVGAPIIFATYILPQESLIELG